MKLKKIIHWFSLMTILLFLVSFEVPNIKAAEEKLEVGDLVKVEGVKGSAVYEYGADGTKHIYMDEQSYKTWHEDFKEVKSVSVSVLDSVPDGKVVPVRPGSLVTTANTAKVYVVGDNGSLYHIPSEESAKNMLGSEWEKNIKYVDPGILATVYTNTGQELSQNNLPSGTIVNEQNSEQYYLLTKNNKKRLVTPQAYGVNRLDQVLVVNVSEIPETYQLDIPVKIKEDRITNFTPVEGNDIEICHHSQTSNYNKWQTIKISENALKAHLAHGDTEGKCADYVEPVPVPTCKNVVVDTRPAEGGTYWQSLGLDMSTQTKVSRYKIKWFSGAWSPWYTKGVDDIDWKDPNRRVWSYFDDHSHMVEWCQPINDDISDVSCSNGVEPVLVSKQPNYVHYWQDLGLDISAHPEIKKYKIRWSSGAWSPTWYVPGQNDVDWVLDTRRVWSYFDDHEYKYVYCPSL